MHVPGLQALEIGAKKRVVGLDRETFLERGDRRRDVAHQIGDVGAVLVGEHEGRGLGLGLVEQAHRRRVVGFAGLEARLLHQLGGARFGLGGRLCGRRRGR